MARNEDYDPFSTTSGYVHSRRTVSIFPNSRPQPPVPPGFRGDFFEIPMPAPVPAGSGILPADPRRPRINVFDLYEQFDCLPPMIYSNQPYTIFPRSGKPLPSPTSPDLCVLCVLKPKATRPSG